MGGVKGKSGPPGHTHNLKGGWQYLLKHGRVPRGKEHVAAYMESVHTNLVEGLGGRDRITPQQKLYLRRL